MKDLSIKDLNVIYKTNNKRIKAIDHVSVDINEGDSVGIIGESGSGKSTLASAVLRMLPPKTAEVEGEIFYNKEDLLLCGDKRLKELRWKEIAAVFQKSMNNLSPVHRIGEQFEDVYRVHYSRTGRKDIHARVCELFNLVNLAPRVYNMYPHELSGGMLQRLSIALSILLHPSLLIMDEATTALDVITQGQILDEILKMEREMVMTRIMITHDLSVVAVSCKKILVLYAGRLVEAGYIRDVLKNPLHPYTRGLIHSFPSLRGEKKDLVSIPGNLPDLAEECPGCIFAPRCRYANKRCFDERPEDRYIDSSHRVTCHLYGGV